MLSYILNGNGKYACTFIASSFFSLLMLSGLSPVRDFQSDHQNGQIKQIIDQQVACCVKGRGQEYRIDEYRIGDTVNQLNYFISTPFVNIVENPTYSFEKGDDQKNVTDRTLE